MSAFIESLFLVCGGSTEQYGGYAPNNTCDVFNVATHSWEEMEDMAECRHQVGRSQHLECFWSPVPRYIVYRTCRLRAWVCSASCT